ncbi:MAG: hypothetical protein JXE06_09885 [Coriobacteriia bacterium]|nr:hypothetical protein [Coriobacteriia bacterium]
MRRYLALMAVFILVQGVILGVLIWLDTPSDYYLAASVDKSRRLDEAPSPRVVFVGGSSLAFGLNSGVVAEELDGAYHPVNMGLHAGMGLEFELNMARCGIKQGDIVVLSPEYEQLWSDILSDTTVVRILAYHPGAISQVPSWKVGEVLFRAFKDGPSMLARDLAAMQYYGVRNTLVDWVRKALGRGSVSKVGEDVGYHRSTFNEYGDQTAAWEVAGSYRPTAGERTARSLSDERMQNALDAIRLFIDSCHALGVQVVYAYPPVLDTEYEVDKPAIEETAQLLEFALGIAFLNRPSEEVYPASSFYDTAHHLAGMAVQERSQRLGASLAQLLVVSTSPGR